MSHEPVDQPELVGGIRKEGLPYLRIWNTTQTYTHKKKNYDGIKNSLHLELQWHLLKMATGDFLYLYSQCLLSGGSVQVEFRINL